MTRSASLSTTSSQRASAMFALASALALMGCDPAARSIDASGDASPIADASTDASPIDAGPRDAGRDAGRDAASRRDASVPPVDAGAVEPSLRVDTDLVEAALHCPAAFTAGHDPVLLIHGTGANADVAWAWGYVPTLSAQGFDVCTIDLPASSWEDVQTASEYVVHAVRSIAARASRSVSIVAHSQGVLETRWALRWWPNLRASVSDVIGLAGVDHGSSQAEASCAVLPCRAAAQQMRPRSRFLAALNASFEAIPGVDHSSVYSTTDATAKPPTSVLVGASVLAIQDLCPGREVAHAAMVSDAVAYAAVLDALLHDGPLDPARLSNDLCGEDRAPGIDPSLAEQKESDGADLFLSTYFDGTWIASEPPLADYVE